MYIARLFLSLLFVASNLHQIMAANTLVDNDIQAIYEKYILVNDTPEYKYRYVPLPLEKNVHAWRWEGKDLPRVLSLLEFERFIKENNISSSKALAINGENDPEWNFVPHGHLTAIDYDNDPRRYDLHTLNLDQKDFDFVMLNQTLEHLYDPISCLRKIYEHMRPGGILYANLPANSIPHSTPFHYFTGITPSGLGSMVQLAGFRILSIGQWGNLEYLNLMQSTKSWPDYRQLKNPGLNEMFHPVITWIFAIK